jgi:hypothetical protein
MIGDWFEAAGPALYGVPIRDVRRAFRAAWEAVRFPAGSGPFEKLLREAKERAAGQQISHRRPEFAILVETCRSIQVSIGPEGSFFLGCRTAADLLAIDHRLAADWLRSLCRMGTLKLIKRGNWRRREASRYRFVLSPAPPKEPPRSNAAAMRVGLPSPDKSHDSAPRSAGFGACEIEALDNPPRRCGGRQREEQQE